MRRGLACALLFAACAGSKATAPANTMPDIAAPTAAAGPEHRCSDGPVQGDELAAVVLRGTVRTDICRGIVAAAGAPLSEATVDADVVNLYKTGFFDDVVAVVEPSPTGSTLVYELKDRAIIERVEVVGTPAGLSLPAPEIELAVPTGIRRGQAQLLEALHEAGYRAATVDFALQPAGAARTLHYTIVPGTRTVLGKVRFEGLTASRDAVVRKDLTARPGEPLTDERAIYDAVLVQTALFEEALLTSRVSHRIVDAGAATVDLVFEVTEGPVFKLGAVRVSGPRARATKDYAKVTAPLKKGSLARRSLLANAVKAIEAIHAGDQPSVTVMPQTDVKVDKKLVDVNYVVE